MPSKPISGHAKASIAPRAGQNPVSNCAPETFKSAYQDHFERVYRYHLVRTGNVQDAQDLTAETFTAAFEGYASFNPARGSLPAWLLGIAHHKWVAHCRRARQPLPLERANEVRDPHASPEVQVEERLRIEQIARGMHRISPDRATALALCFFAGLTLDEAARTMDRSYEAVKKLVQRGLGDLKKALAENREG